MAVQQMIIDAVAAKVGLSLATLSYATRVVAGEAYQARLDGFFGVRYEVRALHMSNYRHMDTIHGTDGTGAGHVARCCRCRLDRHDLVKKCDVRSRTMSMGLKPASLPPRLLLPRNQRRSIGRPR